ncbi:MAG: hypothetical protein WA211_05805 [Candidatus Acidiferrales bacterium]
MSDDHVLKSAHTIMPDEEPVASASQNSANWKASIASQPMLAHKHKLFQLAWYGVNALLVVAILAALYSFGWEYSTRRYLKGFSDAIVPATAPGDEKVQAILNWMAHGPARLPFGPSPAVPDRDPTDTLNYDALLQVCGTATNAFINLTDTGNLAVRRLLLVDSHMMTKHVVAEVLVNGRWIIVDPAYRLVLRDAQGRTLTREELTNPQTFAEATQNIPAYDPTYTFDRTIHVRIGRIHFLGVPLRKIADRIFPGWDESTTMTLLVERESFAATVASILLVIFLCLLRISLRWFGERRLGVPRVRFREQLLRAGSAFLHSTS